MTLLELRGVTKFFGGVMAVKHLDLDVNDGEIISIIGPNGAGKTTIFNLISGVHRPDSGSIKFRGENIAGLKPYQVCRKGVGRTFQIVKPFPSMTVWDNVLIAGLPKSSISEARRRAMEILELTGLQERGSQLATQLTLAGRKRLEIARALATQPQLLLLDEVFAGLNPVETGKLSSSWKNSMNGEYPLSPELSM